MPSEAVEQGHEPDERPAALRAMARTALAGYARCSADRGEVKQSDHGAPLAVLWMIRSSMEPTVERSFAERIPTAFVAASLFLTQAASALYAGLDHPLPAAWPALSSLVVGVSMIAWFRLYSRRHRIAWVMDMGWFLYAAWYFLVPYYILKREGVRGLSRIGLFCLTFAAAWATGVTIRIWLRVLVVR